MSFPPRPGDGSGTPLPPGAVWPFPASPSFALPRPSAWRRWGRNALLFVLTFLSMFLTGMQYPEGWIGGLKMATALMAILLSHEMGHYLACLYYRVDATLPFFIPAPVLNPLVGTFGAVIRIRSPFPHRRALFDIGIAGPLAGFAICLPVLVLAVFEARIVPAEPLSGTSIALQDPLLLGWVFSWLRDVPEGRTIVLGPLGMAAWFGLFMTGLNLIPVGQLDGGHVLYALLRRRAALIARAVWWGTAALAVAIGPNWLIWAVLIRVLGIQHPPTLHDAAPLGRGRVLVGVLGLAVFAGCFLPNPVLTSWPRFFEALREVSGLVHRWLTSS